MAVFGGTIRSATLGMDTRISVILPYDRPAQAQQYPCKTLYLLHGLGENADSWCRHSAIERYARDYGLAVIMPEVQRSFYLDMVYGLNYFSYVTRELPELCEKMFHLSTLREDSFIAGLSMGGYGALFCGLSHPDRYAGVASFSGAVDIRSVVADSYESSHATKEFIAGLGLEMQVKDEMDLYALSRQAARSGVAPKILLTCGEDDFLFGMNTKFRDHLAELPLDFRFESWTGNHDWNFWDSSVKLMLRHFLGDCDG